MLRTVFLIALTLGIAVILGAGSVSYVLRKEYGFGASALGPWTSFPRLGSRAADPYSKARMARDGELALGRAEGQIFTAMTDSAGAELRRECRYTVEGTVPSARFWTLHPADASLRPLPTVGKRPSALHSRQIVRLPGNVVAISVSRLAEPGNWIAVSGRGVMALVLTLYDTEIIGGSILTDIEMPRILRQGCDA